MPFYAIRVDNDLTKRAERDAAIHDHHAYLKSEAAMIHLGGAFLNDDEAHAIGALYVIEAASLEAARQFADNDPLTKCGSRASIKVSPWRHAVIDREYVFGTERAGAPIPGQKKPAQD